MNQRIRNHLSLAVLHGIVLGATAVAGPAAGLPDRFSIVTAYLCLLLLGCALLLGPLRVLAGPAPPPATTTCRRDAGIWAALTGLAHFFLANALSMNYAYLDVYCDAGRGRPPSPEFRDQLYSWGTILGYVVAVLFLAVARAVERPGRCVGSASPAGNGCSGRAMPCSCSPVVHAFAFQALESRPAVWVGVVIVITGAVLALQIGGIVAYRPPGR